MIRTIADDATRDIWNGVNSKAACSVPRAMWPVIQKKLVQIDAVMGLEDLKVPPGDRLHTLSADLPGYHAIRVSDQYRVLFRFEGIDVYEVSCADPPTTDASGRDVAQGVLEPIGVSQVDAARRMNIPFQRLNAIVKGRRGVSADTALFFEALSRWDAQIWLTLPAKWDLYAVRARGQRPRAKPLPRTA